MKTGDALSIISQIIQFLIFIQFAIILIRTDSLDIIGLLINAFGLIVGVVASIVSALESQ